MSSTSIVESKQRKKKSLTFKSKVGIGFVTGRKHFADLAKTYAANWLENNFTKDNNISLNLLITYDLEYTGAKAEDFRKINPEVFDVVESVIFIDEQLINYEVNYLVSNGVITKEEADLIFGKGYAKKRNAVLYFAFKAKMDYLLFLDDDEYPLAVVQVDEKNIMWKGQNVLGTHLTYIDDAELTHGHHCGYISPIPIIDFDKLRLEDFKTYIKAISNDIINWDSINTKMKDGGITFSDINILFSSEAREVEELNGAKFISGSNLCFNLKRIYDKKLLVPFYNPPGARGEDTILSTCLSDVRVLKVPCYTFHDGFLTYRNLLNGVLPSRLKQIKANSPQIITRFLRASIGWVRYKPLLLYITNRKNYMCEIEQMRENLEKVIPAFCRYFSNNEFEKILIDLDYYHKNVRKYYITFQKAKKVWQKMVRFVYESNLFPESIKNS